MNNNAIINRSSARALMPEEYVRSFAYGPGIRDKEYTPPKGKVDDKRMAKKKIKPGT